MWPLASRKARVDCRREEVLSDLYQRLGRSAVSKVCHLLGNEAEAQDVVQDVFLGLWGRGLVFEDERAVFAYVYKSCTHAAIDRIRASRRRAQVNDETILANLAI